MPLPEKEYYDLEYLAKRWGISLLDVQHYAETGKLICSVHIDMRETEIGIFKKRERGKLEFEVRDKAYVEGLVGIVPADCRKVFRNSSTDTIIFESLKIKGEYLRLADNPDQTVQIKPTDIVVRDIDRDDFENKYNITDKSKFAFRESDSLPLIRPSSLIKNISSNKQTSKNNNAFTHSKNYQSISIDNSKFRFGYIQAEIIRILHQASKTDNPWVHGKVLLYDSGSTASRIRDIFKSKVNWKEIIESDGRGYYRLKIEIR